MKVINNKGLTLLELALAIAIFVLAAGGIVGLFVACATITDTAGNLTRMYNIARDEIENNILSTDFETLASYALLPPAVPNDTSLACYVQDHPTVDNVKIVKVVVSYREKSNRVIGGDKNLNGVADGGDDTDTVGRLTSICEMSTYILKTEA